MTVAQWLAASRADAERRALRHQEGFAMRHVMNFTDVDDRTILESQKAGVPLREYTGREYRILHPECEARKGSLCGWTVEIAS